MVSDPKRPNIIKISSILILDISAMRILIFLKFSLLKSILGISIIAICILKVFIKRVDVRVLMNAFIIYPKIMFPWLHGF